MTPLSHPNPIRDLPRIKGTGYEADYLAEQAWRDSWFSAHEFLASCVVAFIAGFAFGVVL